MTRSRHTLSLAHGATRRANSDIDYLVGRPASAPTGPLLRGFPSPPRTSSAPGRPAVDDALGLGLGGAPASARSVLGWRSSGFGIGWLTPRSLRTRSAR